MGFSVNLNQNLFLKKQKFQTKKDSFWICVRGFFPKLSGAGIVECVVKTLQSDPQL